MFFIENRHLLVPFYVSQKAYFLDKSGLKSSGYVYWLHKLGTLYKKAENGLNNNKDNLVPDETETDCSSIKHLSLI